jgi:hypothetical protein
MHDLVDRDGPLFRCISYEVREIWLGRLAAPSEEVASLARRMHRGPAAMKALLLISTAPWELPRGVGMRSFAVASANSNGTRRAIWHRHARPETLEIHFW